VNWVYRASILMSFSKFKCFIGHNKIMNPVAVLNKIYISTTSPFYYKSYFFGKVKLMPELPTLHCLTSCQENNVNVGLKNWNPLPLCHQNLLLRGEFLIIVYLSDRLCGLVVRVLGYRSGGPGLIPGTTKKKCSGSETGSTQPREYNWGATW
jgi:hypothetical protein